MNKTLKLVLAGVISVAATAASAQNVDNWVNSTGTAWKNGDGTLCWRDASWTPATAAKGCDGALTPAAPRAASGVSQSKITLQADTLYDFDKATLKPEGQATLNKIARDLRTKNEQNPETGTCWCNYCCCYCCFRPKR